MISFDEAVRLVNALAQPLGAESLSIDRASGRVLAAPVVAMIDSPPADCSAMDGYAARDSDLPGRLRVIGESFAGQGFAGKLDPGTTVRIFTGAPVPAGTDRVIVQEVVDRDGDMADIGQSPSKGRHIRLQGSDFRAGEILLQAGRFLSPRALVAAAGADQASLSVWRRPLVRILGTGDELAAPGEARHRPGAIPESVSFGIAALAEQYGGQCLGASRLADDLPTMREAAAKAIAEADLTIVTGGASVGEKDFAKAMFEPLGLKLVFSKVAMKPGKPVWLGEVQGRLVMGLPGNPTSAMVTARLFLAPLVAGLAGRAKPLDWRPVTLATALAECGDRETFHRARLRDGEAVPVANSDSSAQKSLAEADLLLRSRAGESARSAGETIDALSF